MCLAGPPGPHTAHHPGTTPPDHRPAALHPRAAALLQHHLPPAVRKVRFQPVQVPAHQPAPGTVHWWTAGAVARHDQVAVCARQVGRSTSPGGDAAEDLSSVRGGISGEGFPGAGALDPET